MHAIYICLLSANVYDSHQLRFQGNMIGRLETKLNKLGVLNYYFYFKK